MSDDNHYCVNYRRTLVPGLTREQLAELSGHTYAKWRSRRSCQAILLFRLEVTGCDVAFYLRTAEEHQNSLEPMPEGSHVATYHNSIAKFRVDTPMTAHLDSCLAVVAC
jgi:hypothetical protein